MSLAIEAEPIKISKEFYQDSLIQRPGLLPSKAGMNSFLWDMRYPDATSIETGNNALISGDTYKCHEFEYVDAGASGLNQTWDFSKIKYTRFLRCR